MTTRCTPDPDTMLNKTIKRGRTFSTDSAGAERPPNKRVLPSIERNDEFQGQRLPVKACDALPAEISLRYKLRTRPVQMTTGFRFLNPDNFPRLFRELELLSPPEMNVFELDDDDSIRDQDYQSHTQPDIDSRSWASTGSIPSIQNSFPVELFGLEVITPSLSPASTPLDEPTISLHLPIPTELDPLEISAWLKNVAYLREAKGTRFLSSVQSLDSEGEEYSQLSQGSEGSPSPEAQTDYSDGGSAAKSTEGTPTIGSTQHSSLIFKYVKGDIFNAPPNSLLLHSCNCQGRWGAGIADTFRKKYPAAFQEYKSFCAAHKGKDLLGKALLIPSVASSKNKVEIVHYIGCLFTSTGFGRAKSNRDVILEATKQSFVKLLNAVAKLKEYKDGSDNENEKDEAISEIRMPMINSGLFDVPWEMTKKVLEELKCPGSLPFKVLVYERP